MSASPLLSWKRDPPESSEEAKAASLLRAVGPPLALAPDTLERLGRRVRVLERTQRAHSALRRRARLAFETDLASIASALAMAGILAALAWLLMDLTTR